MKIEYTEEKNKSIMEDLITSDLDVKDMMAVGYALAKQIPKDPVVDPSNGLHCCPNCNEILVGQINYGHKIPIKHCNECGQAVSQNYK